MPTESGEMAYRRASETDLPAITRLLSHAFAGKPGDVTPWLVDAGVHNLRTLGENPRACLLRIEMGQYFGGKSVPMLGVAGVAVAPEARGEGLARRMMGELIREAHADGFALSALYASTQALYRQVGYEQGGVRCRITIQVRDIGVRAREPRVVPLTKDDQPAIAECYRRYASAHDGMLDRGDYVWKRVWSRREDEFHPFGVRGTGGEIRGYLFLHQRRNKDTGRQDLILSDACANTHDASRRLLGFLGDFTTMGDSLTLFAGPLHPWLAIMPEQRFVVEHRELWMLRVVDAPKALAMRGYGPGIEGEAHLDIHDDLVGTNSGPLVLRVKGGVGEVTRGGRGSVRASARGLAALYTGAHSARSLIACGLADGSEGAVREAAALFAAPGVASMHDFF